MAKRRKYKKKGWDKVINNPVAKHSQFAGKGGCHEEKKYTRKKKHKEDLTVAPEE